MAFLCRVAPAHTRSCILVTVEVAKEKCTLPKYKVWRCQKSKSKGTGLEKKKE